MKQLEAASCVIYQTSGAADTLTATTATSLAKSGPLVFIGEDTDTRWYS